MSSQLIFTKLPFFFSNLLPQNSGDSVVFRRTVRRRPTTTGHSTTVNRLTSTLSLIQTRKFGDCYRDLPTINTQSRRFDHGRSRQPPSFVRLRPPSTAVGRHRPAPPCFQGSSPTTPATATPESVDYSNFSHFCRRPLRRRFCRRLAPPLRSDGRPGTLDPCATFTD